MTHLQSLVLKIHLFQKEITMSVNALQTALSQLATDTASLIALAEVSVPQAEVDTIAASVTALDGTVQAAIAAINPPAVPVTPAA